jgi:quercetin dioxygenase-like cupin family protein
MKVRQYQPLMALALVMACSEGSEPTAAPGSNSSSMSAMDHMSAAVTTTAAATPFTVRATLEPFRIDQADFTMQSKTKSDIVIQQSVFAPGPGMWHTHPGPSFIYVLDGQIKLQKSTEAGCKETPVYGPGQAYFEVGNQVHRAVVVSATQAVVLVTRFSIPVGQPFTIPAADPGCFSGA